MDKSSSSKMIDKILVRVTINVLQINLITNFPCKICFQLKSSQTISKKSLSYELTNGQCSLTEKIDIDILIERREEVLPQKYIEVITYLVSASGEIPAGHASVPLIQNNQILGIDQKYLGNLSIVKCPDKDAKISYYLSSIIVSTQKKVLRQDSQKKAKLLSESKIEQNRKSRGENIKRIKQTITNIETPIRIVNRDSYKKIYRRDESSGQSSDNSFDQSRKKDIESVKNISHSRHNSADEQRQLNLGSSTYMLQKLKKLQRDKTELKKEIIKLKAELLNQKSQSNSSKILNQDIAAFKQQIKELASKCFIFERKQKSLHQELKIKEQQINRLIQTKQNMEQSHRIYIDKLNLETQKQSHSLMEDLQDCEKENQMMKMEIETLKHKFQLKTETLNQEIERLKKKNQEIDKHRKQIMNDYNNSLQNHKQNEKKKQKFLIDKEKQFQKEIKSLNLKLMNLQQINKTLVAQNSSLKADCQGKNLGSLYQKEYIETMELKNKQILSKNMAIEEENLKLQQQIKKKEIQLIKKNKDIDYHISMNQEKIQGQKKQKQKLMQRILSICAQMEIQKNTISEKKSEINMLQNKIHQFSIKIKQIQTQNTSLEHKNRELQRKHQKIASQLQTANNNFKQMQQRYNQACLNNIKNQTQQNSSVSKRIEELQFHNNQLCDLLNAKDSQIDSFKRENIMLKIDIQKLSKLCTQKPGEQLTLQNNMLQNKIKQLQLALNQERNRNYQLEEELRNCLGNWEAQKSEFLKNFNNRNPQKEIQLIINEIKRATSLNGQFS